MDRLLKDNSNSIILPFFNLQISDIWEAEETVEKADIDKWNVVSIYSSYWNTNGAWGGNEEVYIPEFPKAKRLCQQRFSDITIEQEGKILCTLDHIKQILEFSKECVGENLLIHCHAGISRSTAIGFLILLDLLKNKSKTPAEDAGRLIYQIRPIAMPNQHILNLGIPYIAGDEDIEIRWFRELYNSRVARSFGL